MEIWDPSPAKILPIIIIILIFITIFITIVIAIFIFILITLFITIFIFIFIFIFILILITFKTKEKSDSGRIFPKSFPKFWSRGFLHLQPAKERNKRGDGNAEKIVSEMEKSPKFPLGAEAGGIFRGFLLWKSSRGFLEGGE